MGRSIKSILMVAAFVAGVACGDLGEALEGAECFRPSDCGPLNCVAPNYDGLNPTGFGWCLEQELCIIGEQPYCPCGLDPASSMPRCQTPALTGNWVQASVACWDGADLATCLCLPPEVFCKYDPP